MNVAKLIGVIPEHIVEALTPDFLLKAGIDGPRRLSNFLGQLMEECANFNRMVENLNYSADGLAKTWPSRYAIDTKATEKKPNALAMKLRNDPVAIANNCYCNRNGNGDEASGDGYKYRGRGPVMITGKGTYKDFQAWLTEEGFEYDIMNNPDFLATDITVGLLSAAWFFGVFKNMWSVCDAGVLPDNIKAVTLKVNGGVTNLQQRVDHTQRVFKALTA